MLGNEHPKNPVEAFAGHRQRLGAAAGRVKSNFDVGVGLSFAA
jgi:hypothetical protein